MNPDALSIGELADAAGLSRRAVRFYVQQKLLEPPAGVGRGRHYGREHLNQPRRIAELQAAGHSQDEIRQTFDGQRLPPLPPRPPGRPLGSAELWPRVRVAEPVAVHLDAA